MAHEPLFFNVSLFGSELLFPTARRVKRWAVIYARRKQYCTDHNSLRRQVHFMALLVVTQNYSPLYILGNPSSWNTEALRVGYQFGGEDPLKFKGDDFLGLFISCSILFFSIIPFRSAARPRCSKGLNWKPARTIKPRYSKPHNRQGSVSYVR